MTTAINGQITEATIGAFQIQRNLDFITAIGLSLGKDNNDILPAKLKYLLSLPVDKLDDDAKSIISALNLKTAENSIWIRSDWTPDLFLEMTQGWSDETRQQTVLETRDIPLISWYVNYRAGRVRHTNVPQALLQNQAKIIQSELNEAFVSIASGNGSTLRDDIPDLFLTVAGFGAYYNANLTTDFVDMVRSNFTRIDTNRDDAELTLAKYTEKGIPCQIEETEAGTFPVLVTEETTIGDEVYPVGKFMKSHKFTDASYDDEDGFTPSIQMPVGEGITYV